MRGKKTHKRADYRGLEAGWVHLRTISPRDWKALERAVGRKLDSANRAHIQNAIDIHRSMLDVGRQSRVSAQDILESLQDLASTPLDTVKREYERTSGFVQAEIATALLRSGIRDGDALANPSADQIRSAAADAAAQVHGAGGRPTELAMFDRAVIHLWIVVGGGAMTSGPRQNLRRAFVDFVDAVFVAAGGICVERAALRARFRPIVRKAV